VLNANYIRKRLDGAYHLPYETASLHECVFSDKFQNEHDVKTLDIAKRLMDYGMHPPTVYFPLIVHGAIMIEPTESESKAACDQFCDTMLKIAEECKTTRRS
jgi:glycine dehydrogenase subunit 2